MKKYLKNNKRIGDSMNDNHLRNILLSDANIYKAILSVSSYMYNPQLMDDKDLDLYYELMDKFNYDRYFRKDNNYKNLIEEIREIIENVIDDEEELFSTKVYFKLKKPKNGIYRPLHVSSVKDSIAIVAMLQVLVYDMDYSNENKMKLSNLAKMIPSNFYGNIPSKSPERLFERWQDKYKEYTEKANDKFAEYENNGKYKFEVTLDLKNFFPSINPLLVYNFILNALKVKFTEDEFELVKKITFKLLFFRIDNFEKQEDSFFRKLYYTDSNQNTDFSEIKVSFQNKNIYITKGIPQGLPQSYFFGNLIMINVAGIYNKFFDGESIYYVDDSYIYTNKNLSKELFKKAINDLNNELEKYSLMLEKNKENIESLPFNQISDKLKKQCNNKCYLIQVHTEDKSSYLSVKDTKTGYKYLKFLSRLASMGSFDFKTTFSDFEEIQLKDKFETLIEAIKKEINLYCEIIQKANDCDINESNNCYERCVECRKSKDCTKFDKYEEYFDKLKRFKRFFQYRITMIQMQKSDESINSIIKELEKLTNNELADKFDEDIFEMKLRILDDYLIDRIDCIDDFQELLKQNVHDKVCNKNIKQLKILYSKIEEFEMYYSKNSSINFINKKLDYFYYYKVFNCSRRDQKRLIDPYGSIYKIISKKINLKHKHHEYQMIYLKELLNVILGNKIVEYAFNIFDVESSITDNLKNEKKYLVISYWTKRSKYLQRYIINTIISLILNIELNENLYITRHSKKPLNYFELRLAIASRNKKLDLSLISKILMEYIDSKQIRNLDYTVFEAIYYFRVFAREPKYIDNLILIHKYTTELWENGSKYMHFYTLHNQVHAVELIKNINTLIKAIDYLKISKIDYYILYISCYLHDISMVIYPKQDRFLIKDWDESNLILMSFIENLKKKDLYDLFDQQSVKKLLLDVYEAIDILFENEVRNNHAKNSADYVRNSNDLLFIDKAILDIVADISYSHGIDTRDVYYLKSSAKGHLISKKFMMILIRLADIFDMSENRVSVPIFYNNKANMSPTTKFHWISHLITGNFKIINKYNIKKPDFKNLNPSYFKPRTIEEIITIEINVNLNQMTKIDIHEKCDMVCMQDYNVKNIIKLEIQDHNKKCEQENCNFICKWFMKKNWYMINELCYLQNYLSDVGNYFETSFNIKLKLNDNNMLRSEDFDDLKDYITMR